MKFVVILAFSSYIITPLVTADARGRSAYDVVRTEDDACFTVDEGPMFWKRDVHSLSWGFVRF